MPVEFGTAKTVFILAIVVGCFAVLWPKLFYPMLQASVTPRPPSDSQACCDVIFENDVNAIKVMTELCGNILHQYDEFDPQLTQIFSQGKLTKDIVNTCRNEVLSKCGIDITSFLNERVRLGKSYKQILDEIRSFNSSICLKLNFGVNLGSLGAPRRMRLGVLSTPKHYRQERPPHLRPDMLHPALRERGRAIPQTHIVPRTIDKEPRPPIPGMRPPMGGPGHVVPPPKGSSTMGIIMPIYTIGIVIFFMYTIMKVMFKKPSDTTSYSEFAPDPEFHKIVFDNYGERPSYDDGLRQRSKIDPGTLWKCKEDGTKLVVTAISGLIAEVDHQREKLSKQAEEQNGSESENKEVNKSTEIINLNSSVNQNYDENIKQVLDVINHSQLPIEGIEVAPTTADSQVDKEKETLLKLLKDVEAEEQERPNSRAEEDGATKVKVMGMETTASCECGHRWSRPSTPILGIPAHTALSRSSTPVPPPTPEPQAIYLEGSLPSQSKLLVSDAETQAMTVTREAIEQDDSETPVILSGKMTLSLISLDAAISAEDEQLKHQYGEGILAADNAEAREDPDKKHSVSTNINKGGKEEEEKEEEEEEDEEEEEEEEEEEGEADENENPGENLNIIDEEKKSEERMEILLVNDTHHELDDTPSATNYTTASAAAEATNATGTEETAADFSAIESIEQDDEQQEELEEEVEVWNGEVHSGEEEEEEEEENDDGSGGDDQPVQHIPNN